MTPPPTVGECSEWIAEHCATLLTSIATCPIHAIKQKVAIALDSARILISALDAPAAEVARLSDQLSQLRARFEENTDRKQIKAMISSLQDVCNRCNAWIPSRSFVKLSSNHRIEQSKIIPQRYTPADYASMWPDQVDAKASWFRRYFVGKPYITLIGPQKDDTYVIISVVREYANEFCEDTFKGSQYRIIVRGKEPPNHRHVVHESQVRDAEARLESLGQSHLLDSVYSEAKRKPLRSLSSALINGHHSNLATKHLRAAVLSVYQDLDLRPFKELAAEATILAGLEKEFLRFDEIGIPRCYKFGILTVRDGQETEEEWFSNSGLSRDFEHFLDMLGTRVELKDYKGYAAGLDTKSKLFFVLHGLDDSMLNHVHNVAGESGDVSYMSSWNDHEIMFHVAPLMPPRHDKQQVHRKRYIGNDIVCVVFVESGKQAFDPNAIRSQFLHVYIVVHPEMTDGNKRWRQVLGSKQVVYNDKVGEFGPELASPPLLYEEDLRGFLILKLINAENAALKSDKFAVPNTKARRGILKTLVETGLEATNVTRSFSTSRLASEDNLAGKSGGRGGERPKSAGAQRNSRGSLRSLRAALESPPRSMTPDLPPVPTTSRSSVLRDLKSLARRKSNGHTVIEDHPKSRLTNGSEEKEQKICRAGLSSLKDQPQPSAEPNQKSTALNEKGIRSRAQSIMTSVMGRRPSRTNTASTTLKLAAAAGGLTRSRTFLTDHSGRLIQGSNEDIHQEKLK
ncbi:signal-induced proliferation-associated 1-like protein 3 [Apophysomyces sp. BC1015]|nr:signal-induced proliferation-associated 1-like protein 3 [Apophysomyces sp. BC1015]